jgi:hypothetical protein
MQTIINYHYLKYMRVRPMRRGRGLVRTMAATAVVAGTATAVSNKVNRNAQAHEAQQQQEIAAQVAAQQPMAAPAPVTANTANELERLVMLKQSGALTDLEFQQAKSKLLGI